MWTRDWISSTGVLATGSIVLIVVLMTKWSAIKAYIQVNKPQPSFQGALASFWVQVLVLFTILMSIVPYVIPIFQMANLKG